MIHETLLIIKLGITHVYKHITDACCLFPAQTFIPYSTVRLDGIKEERVKKSMTRAQLLRGPPGLKHEKHIQIIQLLRLTQCVTPLHCARCSGHWELIGQYC